MGCESKRDKTMAKVNAIINADSPRTAPSRVKLGRLRDRRHSMPNESAEGRMTVVPKTVSSKRPEESQHCSLGVGFGMTAAPLEPLHQRVFLS